jgi:hypothetical protein
MRLKCIYTCICLQVHIGGNAALMATKITEMFPHVKVFFVRKS